ncbi:hypothetical protein BS50DRAFT_268144 [Corynespora cassiicola Philippines]|uniref:Zn(2)-C6 fungal-type domain-containing protein n=1 Tax=Corynespora cassiicola Philippines TaxID=1448308 RepID=A0A2T2NZG1_CORCC|nr:hypothetical protein BS50DRAFT_268144 [Corynespora cassiicola Philippines]
MRPLQGPKDLPGATGCANCVRRSAVCHFSPLQKPRRKKRRGEAVATTRTTTLAPSPAKSDDTQNRDESDEYVAQDMSQYDGLQELYVDRLLANPHPESSQHAQATSLHGLNVFGTSLIQYRPQRGFQSNESQGMNILSPSFPRLVWRHWPSNLATIESLD